MAKYKVLKSVAHNTGHSFLSDMNYVRTGGALMRAPELIYQTAVESGISNVRVDLVTGEVEPAEFRTTAIMESAGNYRRFLLRQAEAQGVTPDMVREAVLEISFNLSETGPAKCERGAVIPVFKCNVRIVDNRGQLHIASPNHWWRE